MGAAHGKLQAIAIPVAARALGAKQLRAITNVSGIREESWSAFSVTTNDDA